MQNGAYVSTRLARNVLYTEGYKMEEQQTQKKPRRVVQGSISKQRRRNEPIGNIGKRRLHIYDTGNKIEYINSTKDNEEDVKEECKKRGWRLLTTYYADEKDRIDLPSGLKEKYEEYLKKN